MVGLTHTPLFRLLAARFFLLVELLENRPRQASEKTRGWVVDLRKLAKCREMKWCSFSFFPAEFFF